MVGNGYFIGLRQEYSWLQRERQGTRGSLFARMASQFFIPATNSAPFPSLSRVPQEAQRASQGPAANLAGRLTAGLLKMGEWVNIDSLLEGLEGLEAFSV